MDEVSLGNLENLQIMLQELDRVQDYDDCSAFEKEFINAISKLITAAPLDKAKKRLLEIKECLKSNIDFSSNFGVNIESLQGAVETALFLCN
ncbi:hypothetical protein ACFL31_01950 [Candidatus Margulisiibacteriota bacterium]